MDLVPQATQTAQPTAGPWEFQDGMICTVARRSDRAVRGLPIGTTYVGVPGGKPEAHANGVVMAAAPEMKAALEHIRAALNCHYDWRTIESEYGAELDAAIAKAEGLQG